MMKTTVVDSILKRLKGYISGKYTQKEARDVEEILERIYRSEGDPDMHPEGGMIAGGGGIGGFRVPMPKGRKAPEGLPREFDEPTKYLKEGKELTKALREIERQMKEKEKSANPDFIPVPEWNFEKRMYEYNKVGYAVEAYSDSKDGAGIKTFKEKFGRLSDLVTEELKKLKPTARRRVARQTEGTLDISQFIRELKRGMSGKDISDKLYEKLKKEKREYAVGILIDRSGSTKNDVSGGFSRLDIEKYSATLLADALDELGDTFGVYSFSTEGGGKKTALELLKGFEDKWDETRKQYVTSITPGEQNHDGAAIRGMAELLAKRKEKKKVLVHISDGTPWIDGSYYTKGYANQDTLKAIEEAEKAGVRVIYLSIDPNNLDFFKQVAEKCTFAEKYNDVFELPKKITELYLAMRK